MTLQEALKENRRPNLEYLQVSPRSVDCTAPNNANLLPPLSATKSGKFSIPRGSIPRPGLRSRASLDKNGQIPITPTGPTRGASESMPLSPGTSSPKNVTPLSARRTSSLPLWTTLEISVTSPDSSNGQGQVTVQDADSEVIALPLIYILSMPHSFSSIISTQIRVTLCRCCQGRRSCFYHVV